MDVVGIYNRAGAVRVFVERVAVGVGRQEAKIARPALGRDLYRVVAGKLIRLKLVYLRKERIRTIHRDVCSSRRTGVDIVQSVEMQTARSDVSDRDGGGRSDLPLNTGMPLFAVRCLGLRILGEDRQACRQRAGVRRWSVNESIGREVERRAVCRIRTGNRSIVKRPVVDGRRIVGKAA